MSLVRLTPICVPLMMPKRYSSPICAPPSVPNPSASRSPKLPCAERAREAVGHAERAGELRHAQCGRKADEREVGLARIDRAIAWRGSRFGLGRRGREPGPGPELGLAAADGEPHRTIAGPTAAAITILVTYAFIAQFSPSAVALRKRNAGFWCLTSREIGPNRPGPLRSTNRVTRHVRLRPPGRADRWRHRTRRGDRGLVDAVLREVVAERPLADSHRLGGVLLDAVRSSRAPGARSRVRSSRGSAAGSATAARPAARS